MYVNKSLTVKKPEPRINKQGIAYHEVIPAHYVIAIEKPDGWHYGLKIWRWDIDHLYPRLVYFLSTQAFTTTEDAIKSGLEAYRLVESGDHA